MPTTFKDFEDAPNPLVRDGPIAFFAVVAVVALSRMATHQLYAPAILALRPVAHTHIATASRPAPAYLRIRPKFRPWYATTDGEWAARVAECLGWPQDLQDSLRGFRRGFVPAEDFRMMHPFLSISVTPDGRCLHSGHSVIIRDLPKLGAMDVSGIHKETFTQLYFVELSTLPSGSRIFAYRTE